MDLSEIKRLLDEQGAAWAAFRQNQFDPMKAVVQELEQRQQRMVIMGGGIGVSNGDRKELADALRNFLRGDERALKAMSVGSEPDGGFTVLPALSSEMTRVEEDFSPLRQTGAHCAHQPSRCLRRGAR
jgi:HK97 family phage major capsid protein